MQNGALEIVRAILRSARDRDSFFKIVERLFPRMDYRFQTIERAYNAMKDAFRGKFREDGERYFEHLRAVALIVMVYLRVKDYEEIIACILHDATEDVPSWPISRVRSEFGDKVAELVERLSKKPVKLFRSREDRDNAYHGLFRSASRTFFRIKLSDRLHNLLTLGACSQEKIRRKIEETRLHYLPYAEEHLILLHELEAAIDETEENCLKSKNTYCDL